LVRRVPALRMLARTVDELRPVAEGVAQLFSQTLPGAAVETKPDHSEAGGGALAAIPLPTWVVEVRTMAVAAEAIAEDLRRRDLPIICRVRDGALVFDPRTLEADDADQVAVALAEVVRALGDG